MVALPSAGALRLPQTVDDGASAWFPKSTGHSPAECVPKGRARALPFSVWFASYEVEGLLVPAVGGICPRRACIRRANGRCCAGNHAFEACLATAVSGSGASPAIRLRRASPSEPKPARTLPKGVRAGANRVPVAGVPRGLALQPGLRQGVVDRRDDAGAGTRCVGHDVDVGRAALDHGLGDVL